jgi:hypothetical protein
MGDAAADEMAASLSRISFDKENLLMFSSAGIKVSARNKTVRVEYLLLRHIPHTQRIQQKLCHLSVIFKDIFSRRLTPRAICL